MPRYRIVFSLLLVFTFAAPSTAGGAAPTEMARMPAYGPQDAPLTFTVWGSLSCPFTRQLMPILKRIADDYEGMVNIEWRHYPIHPPDPALHVYSMADPSRFWDFLFALLDKAGTFHRDTGALAVEVGREIKLSAEKIRATQENDQLWYTVKQDFLAAKLTGIRATPGLFHDGYFLTPNGMPQNLKEFEGILRNIVEKSQR